MDLEFGLRLPDMPLGGGEFLALDRCQPGDQPPVDGLLATPGVERLVADLQVTREVGDLPTRGEQVEYTMAELRRVSPSSRGCLLSGGQPHDVQ